MNLRRTAKVAGILGALALTMGIASAEVEFAGSTTIIRSGDNSLGPAEGGLVPPLFDDYGYEAGVYNDSGLNGYGVTFQYGSFDGTTFTNINTPPAPGVTTSGTARNVLPAEGLDPYFYDQLPEASWISAYADETAGADYQGSLSNRGEALDLGVNQFPETFRYDVTFNLAPDSALHDGLIVSGDLLSDDKITAVWLDGVPLSLVTLNPLGSPAGPLYYRFGLSGNPSRVDGIGSTSPLLNRKLSFFVQNEGNQRTALNFNVTITAVPEPGAVAFGVIMGGGLLGLGLRARRKTAA